MLVEREERKVEVGERGVGRARDEDKVIDDERADGGG